MKQFYTLITFMLITLTTQAQNGYEFALLHDGGYAFSIVATPNFDATATDISDIGFALMLPTGNADVTNLSQFNGRAWSATEVTAAQLTGIGLGDGTRDGFAMNLPPGQTILSHTSGTPFTLVSFEVSNMPNSGVLEILANTDPIAIGLGGAVDSFYNSNIDETTTQNYFNGITSGAGDFSFATLSVHQVKFETSVTIFPNPTFNLVTVNSTADIKNLELYDLLGKRVLEVSNTNSIKIGQLPNGVYLLKIMTQQNAITKRIVKQ